MSSTSKNRRVQAARADVGADENDGGSVAAGGRQLLEPHDGLGQTCGVHRLGKVIEGVCFKGLQGVFVVGSHKYEGWLGLDPFQPGQQIEAVVGRHLHIEKNHIGLGRGHQIHGGLHAMGLANDHDFRMGCQSFTEVIAHQ